MHIIWHCNDEKIICMFVPNMCASSIPTLLVNQEIKRNSEMKRNGSCGHNSYKFASAETWWQVPRAHLYLKHRYCGKTKWNNKQNEMKWRSCVHNNLSGSSPWHSWVEVHVAMDTQFFWSIRMLKLTVSGRSKQASKQASMCTMQSY